MRIFVACAMWTDDKNKKGKGKGRSNNQKKKLAKANIVDSGRQHTMGIALSKVKARNLFVISACGCGAVRVIPAVPVCRPGRLQELERRHDPHERESRHTRVGQQYYVSESDCRLGRCSSTHDSVCACCVIIPCEATESVCRLKRTQRFVSERNNALREELDDSTVCSNSCRPLVKFPCTSAESV